MKRYLAELLGTFVLVFGGCGAAVLAGGKIGFAGVAFAFGFSLLAMVYAIGPVSGCHINPAVTVGLLLSGKFEAKYAPGYVIAQILGGIVAAGLLLIVAGGTSAGVRPIGGGLRGQWLWRTFSRRVQLDCGVRRRSGADFFSGFHRTWLTDVKAPVGFAGIPIGIVLVLIHLVGIPVTNTSVNPARSIGPALFVGGWALGQLWLFIVAPLIGAAIASGLYSMVRSEPLIQARVAEAALPSEQVERAR